MWIIIDKKIPEEAKKKLSTFGHLLELESHNIVYNAISGHPDIFLCQTDHKLIVAHGAPSEFVNKLQDYKIEYHLGSSSPGNKYPETARYNAVVTENLLIHNLKITDTSILDHSENKTKIHCNQAYTRCNLIALNNNSFITSDKGIEKVLLKHHFNTLYIDPKGIILPGFPNGFFGGCCGVFEKKLFINGSLNFTQNKDTIIEYVTNSGFEIIELYEGPLYDGGSIFFVNP